MKRILITALTLAMALAAFAVPPRPGAGPAGPNPGPGRLGPGPGAEVLSPELLAQFLALTEQQIEQAKSIHQETRAAIEPLREQLRENREQLDAALDAGNAQTAGELLLANRALNDQIKAIHDGTQAKFEAILTAEQKAKFAIYQEIVELRGSHGPRD